MTLLEVQSSPPPGDNQEMTKPNDPFPKVKPFVEPKTQPRRNGVDVRGLLSTSLMLVSFVALSVALSGAGIVVFEILSKGFSGSATGLGSKLIVLGLAYVFGWGTALVSIRGFGNLIYPLLIKIYAWMVLAAVGFVYIRAIYKLYNQFTDISRFWAYVLVLIGGLLVLISLHLLVEGHDLRPFAVPLLIISVLQLFVTVFHYVYFTANLDPLKLWNDLLIFFLMVSIAALMLIHLGILDTARSWIDSLFSHNGNGNGNGKSKDNEQHWVK